MENHPVFQRICSLCGGKCCRTTIFLTGSEFQFLKERKQIISHNSDGTIRLGETDVCPFLSDTGCSLPYELRPLDCRIFPFAFLLKDGKLFIYKNHKCAYADQVTQEWMLVMKKSIEIEILRWTLEDKYRYSSLINRQLELLECCFCISFL